MSKTFVERVTPSVNNVAGGIEIGLANLEMNNVAPFCFERARFDQNFKRGLSPETRHSSGKAKLP